MPGIYLQIYLASYYMSNNEDFYHPVPPIQM